MFFLYIAEVGRKDWDKTVKLTTKSFDDLAVTDGKHGKTGAKTFKTKVLSLCAVLNPPQTDSSKY